MKFRYQKLPLQGAHLPWTARPLIPVSLHSEKGSLPAPYYALLDSGADTILLPAEFAAHLGIEDLTTGRRGAAIGVAGQRAVLYYHEVQLQIVGDPTRLDVEAGFSAEVYIPLLGRSFFAHFRKVVFMETKERVELVR